MRFLADDGMFGVLVSPQAGMNMFRFQLVVESQLIGDREPCIIGSAMRRLANIANLDVLDFDPAAAELSFVAETLGSDEFHDSVTLSLAESLDAWLIFGLRHEGKLTMVAQENRKAKPTGDLLRSVVDSEEYSSIIASASRYWRDIAS